MKKTNKGEDSNVPLHEMISTLRRELQASMEEATNQRLQFRLDKVELELQVEVGWNAGAEAGVKFWVVSIGGKGSRSSTQSHLFKITLTPVSSTNGQVRVGEETTDPSLQPR